MVRADEVEPNSAVMRHNHGDSEIFEAHDENIDMHSMGFLVSQVRADVPRFEHHLVWRLALFLRHQTPLVNEADRSFLTWQQLGLIFGHLNYNAFRSYVLRRKAQHNNHEDSAFNIFQVEADQPRRRQREVPDAAIDKIVELDMLQRQLCMALQDRVDMIREEMQVEIIPDFNNDCALNSG